MSAPGAGSFEELFREQYPSVLRDVVFVVGDRDLAKEIVNEAFTRLYSRWRRVSRYDKPGAWVRRVAIRLAVRQEGRRRREVVDQEASVEHDSHTGPDVRSAVRQLPSQQRAAVMLHYFDDLPLADVAGVLGCREGTVKAHLYQARAKLAPLLSDYSRCG